MFVKMRKILITKEEIISLEIGNSFSIIRRADSDIEILIHQLEQRKTVVFDDPRTAHDLKTHFDNLKMKSECFIALQEENTKAIENEDHKIVEKLKKKADNLIAFPNYYFESEHLSYREKAFTEK
jgi:hypothetical protein